MTKFEKELVLRLVNVVRYQIEKDEPSYLTDEIEKLCKILEELANK